MKIALKKAFDYSFFEKKSRKLRGKIIELSYNGHAAHLGSCLSCIDILTILYWKYLNIDPVNPLDNYRDRLILSKGHAAMALYSCIAEKGFISNSELKTFNQNNGRLAEHPPADMVPGIEAGTGSLGHGFSIGLGIALSAIIRDLNYKVYVIVGDGELNEGSIWEGALFAAAQNLYNFNVIIDCNKWQGTCRSDDTLSSNSISKKFDAFGWKTTEVDGHDFMQLDNVFLDSEKNKKPFAIIANTIKGKGISFMEDDNNWHYKIPNELEVNKSKRELGLL